jgi:CTP:molybdopterin cytidylyltransferase MocA
MGPRQKLLEPFRGLPMIEYSLEAAAKWHPLIIASRDVANYLQDRPELQTIVNDSPYLGMTHSLRLADAALPDDISIIVLLADKPLISAELITQIRAIARDVDVAYPVNSRAIPGHPVVFSPRARRKIADLPDGDSIKLVRDNRALTRRTLLTADVGAFFDVDTADELSR